MDKPSFTFDQLSPLFVQHYERYLPTAFDEGMTLLEKVNKIILYLNQIGKLSNDVMEQWSSVMDWVMADGLDASIDAKIDSMLADGTLATVIGKAITDLNTQFTALQTTVTTNKTSSDASIATLNTNVAANTANILVNTNKVTNMKFYGTPEEYGAKGDGINDDTLAIQNCMNANTVTILKPTVYKITTTLKLPHYKSIQGNGACFKVSGAWTGSNYGVNIPVNSMLWVEGRDPVAGTELQSVTKYVKDLRLEGDESYNLTGLYLGTVNKALITQPSSVNYAVYGYLFANIAVNRCYDGVAIGEAWGCSFNNVATGSIRNKGLGIKGQSVNNTFMGCQFGTGGLGVAGLEITGDNYASAQYRRPEGNSFIGGFYGYASIGISLLDELATIFTGLIIDLNDYGVVIETGDFATFTDCWINAMTAIPVSFHDRSSATNLGNVSFKGCKFVNGRAGTDSVYVGINQNGIIIDGCYVDNAIRFNGTNGGVVKDNFIVTPPTSNPMIFTGTGSTIVTTNNVFKTNGAAVTVAV